MGCGARQPIGVRQGRYGRTWHLAGAECDDQEPWGGAARHEARRQQAGGFTGRRNDRVAIAPDAQATNLDSTSRWDERASTDRSEDGGVRPSLVSERRHDRIRVAGCRQRRRFVVDVDSGRVRQITDHPAEDKWPTYSRDGRHIYFSSNRGGVLSVYKMPADGGEPHKTTRGAGVHATESADGQFLYYARQEDRSIWRMPLRSGDEEKVLTIADYNRGWTLGRHGIYHLTPIKGGFSIRHFDLETSIDSEIFRDSGRAFYLTLTPDEEGVLFSKEDRMRSELFVVDGFSME